MFAKDRVSQSLIDAVNKVLATESKQPEQLNEAFPTVADAQKRASEPKPRGGAGVKLGTRYGGGRQADEPEKDDDDAKKEPKKREKYGARKDRFTNTKLYKEDEVQEELKGNQHKIDANKNGKIDAHDFKLLRSKKTKVSEEMTFAEKLIESMYGKKSALPIDEKEMSDAQKKKKEDIVMSMKKDTEGLKKRYGSRWKDVMYATATKQAMKKETYGEEVELDEAKKTQSKDEKDKVVAAVQAAMRKSRGNVIAGKAQLAAARLAAKVKSGMKEEVEEFEEEIDPNVRSKDAISGANKPTKQKDDVGPGADGRSTKVKFKGGPMDEEAEKENEKEDEGHEDEKEDKALVKKMVKKDALKEEEQLDELKKSTVKSYLSKTVDPVYGIPKSKEKISQRMKGISAAHQRIVGNKPTSEEVEQIDELSKDTLSSYLQKRGSMVSPRSKNNKGNENMAKAANKMANKKTNEEVELDETSHMNKPRKLKSFMSMKKEMLGKAGMTSEKKDEE